MDTARISLIINPASAGGRTGERIHRILSSFDVCFGKKYFLHVTSQPGDAIRIARESVERDYSLIVCAGGDGTIQETINGMFSADYDSSATTLGIISTGTGEGFAHSLGLPPSIEEQVCVLKKGDARWVDVGRIDFPDNGEHPARRFFINEYQLGIGGAVVRHVNGTRHRLNGSLVYGGSALFTALRYTPHTVHIRAEGREAIDVSCIGIVIANGELTGGGMRLAPGADLTDGMLNVLLIHDQSVAARLRGFSRIYSGTHTSLPGFSYFTTTRIQIGSDDEIPQEADGQLFSKLPCTVSVLPSVLRVCCANGKGSTS